MHATASQTTAPQSSVYFTENGDVWSADSHKSIAHAVLTYKNGTVIEGAHNGRYFDGLLQVFKLSHRQVIRVMVCDADGKKDEAASDQAARKAASSPKRITLENSLSQSPGAAAYLKTLVNNPKS